MKKHGFFVLKYDTARGWRHGHHHQSLENQSRRSSLLLSAGQLTCAKPEDIPAMVTDLNDSGSFNRRLTLPYTPKQIALMTATPASGEVMPR